MYVHMFIYMNPTFFVGWFSIYNASVCLQGSQEHPYMLEKDSELHC